MVRVSLAQRSRGRGAVAVLDRSEGSSVAVVLLADLAVVGGRAHRGALLSLHGGALDLRDLVAHLPGDVPTLLPLHLVTHLTQHNSSQYTLSQLLSQWFTLRSVVDIRLLLRQHGCIFQQEILILPKLKITPET